MNHAEKRLAGTAVRLRQLHTAAVYDIMDAMGLPNQCLDLCIKPLDRSMRIAGRDGADVTAVFEKYGVL